MTFGHTYRKLSSADDVEGISSTNTAPEVNVDGRYDSAAAAPEIQGQAATGTVTSRTATPQGQEQQGAVLTPATTENGDAENTTQPRDATAEGDVEGQKTTVDPKEMAFRMLLSIVRLVVISTVSYGLWMHGSTVATSNISPVLRHKLINLRQIIMYAFNPFLLFWYALFYALLFPIRLCIWTVAHLIGKTNENIGFGLAPNFCNGPRVVTCIRTPDDMFYGFAASFGIMGGRAVNGTASAVGN
jgi:hypothetical protein